jgi:hypothetical protein
MASSFIMNTMVHESFMSHILGTHCNKGPHPETQNSMILSEEEHTGTNLPEPRTQYL